MVSGRHIRYVFGCSSRYMAHVRFASHAASCFREVQAGELNGGCEGAMLDRRPHAGSKVLWPCHAGTASVLCRPLPAAAAVDCRAWFFAAETSPPPEN